MSLNNGANNAEWREQCTHRGEQRASVLRAPPRHRQPRSYIVLRRCYTEIAHTGVREAAPALSVQPRIIGACSIIDSPSSSFLLLSLPLPVHAPASIFRPPPCPCPLPCPWLVLPGQLPRHSTAPPAPPVPAPPAPPVVVLLPHAHALLARGACAHRQQRCRRERQGEQHARERARSAATEAARTRFRCPSRRRPRRPRPCRPRRR
jgi:hypothetical protein